MEYSTLIARLKTASESFENLEVQLADPDIANDPKKLESIAKERRKYGLKKARKAPQFSKR